MTSVHVMSRTRSIPRKAECAAIFRLNHGRAGPAEGTYGREVARHQAAFVVVMADVLSPRALRALRQCDSSEWCLRAPPPLG